MQFLQEKRARKVLFIGVRRGPEAEDAIGLEAVQAVLDNDVGEDTLCADSGLIVEADGVACLERQHRA